MRIKSAKLSLFLVFAGAFLFGFVPFFCLHPALSFADSTDEASAGSTVPTDSPLGNFVTIYDSSGKGQQTIKTGASTVAEVLERIDIALDDADIVEPGLDTEISENYFRINIYRAHPTTVTDDNIQIKLMTASTDPRTIAEEAGLTLRPEDAVNFTTSNNFLETGMLHSYVITRAKEIKLNFYGTEASKYTQAPTVAKFLKEQGIKITKGDWLSLPKSTKITDGLELALYRQGTNTINIEEDISFTEIITHDSSRPVGYRAITAEGQKGKKTVTYEVDMKDGQEISKKPISELTTIAPIPRQVTIGTRMISMNPLTKQMGRNRYTTADGLAREETYYDLPMIRVMQNCGGDGHYSIRYDGVKIDKDDYVIVAANLNLYPRCSIVQTSLGPGKVYDTGSFADHNAHQFDIATDWTNRDGR